MSYECNGLTYVCLSFNFNLLTLNYIKTTGLPIIIHLNLCAYLHAECRRVASNHLSLEDSNHSLLAVCCHLSPVCVRCVGTQRRLHHLLEALWPLPPDESVVGQQRQDFSQSVFEGSKAQIYKSKKDKLKSI